LSLSKESGSPAQRRLSSAPSAAPLTFERRHLNVGLANRELIALPASARLLQSSLRPVGIGAWRNEPTGALTAASHQTQFPTRNCRRHGFTFPSNDVAGPAAQSNLSVSIETPRRVSKTIDDYPRRIYGYTVKC